MCAGVLVAKYRCLDTNTYMCFDGSIIHMKMWILVYVT